jgi:hypothetical protein
VEQSRGPQVSRGRTEIPIEFGGVAFYSLPSAQVAAIAVLLLESRPSLKREDVRGGAYRCSLLLLLLDYHEGVGHATKAPFGGAIHDLAQHPKSR